MIFIFNQEKDNEEVIHEKFMTIITQAAQNLFLLKSDRVFTGKYLPKNNENKSTSLLFTRLKQGKGKQRQQFHIFTNKLWFYLI